MYTTGTATTYIRRKCQHRASGFCYATLCRRLYMVSFKSPTRPQRQAYTHFFHFVKSQVLLHWTCERVFSAAAARRHQLSYFKNALTLSSMSLYIGKNFAVRIEHERRDTQPRKPSSNAKCAGVLDGLPLPPPSLYAILYFTSIAYNFAI